ncbi:MAG TPA: hypothetical protein VK654_10375, partial [Nitrospirota bacterium]|nr:hypothetical protein [Nitrospirota bacterium]
MAEKRLSLPLAAIVILIITCLPQAVLASTRVVASQCSSSVTTTFCYTNLGDAITAAVAGDDIEIHPGT